MIRPNGVRRWPLIALVALVAGGCSKSTSTPPTTPTPITINDTFTGTLGINGAQTKPFTMSIPGTITTQVTALDPSKDGTVSIGLSLGVWNGTACTVGFGTSNDNAGVGAGVLGEATVAGDFCVRVYDPGPPRALTEPVTFTVALQYF